MEPHADVWQSDIAKKGVIIMSNDPVGLYRTMVRIRVFEEKVAMLFSNGAIYGHVHLYIGQEACAVGVIDVLDSSDRITSTHRGHGHLIAKGGHMDRAMAELFGKASGYCGGRGGSMHITDITVGMLGANAVVGASVPIAVGSALSQRLLRGSVRESGQAVTVAFFGDGGANQGIIHEALNLASIWSLPVIFVCENNGYAISTSASYAVAGHSIANRAASYGMPGFAVDGQDVLAVREATTEAVKRARRGLGPSLIECLTYRFHGHTEGEEGLGWRYRDQSEIEKAKARDPLILLEQHFPNELQQDIRDQIWDMAQEEVNQAVKFAQDSKEPDMKDAYRYVTR